MKRDIFQAVADPTRRKILGLTASRAMTPNEIAENFSITRQAVSKHIKILTRCSLLDQEPAGREIYYRTRPEKLKPIDRWLDMFRGMWDERFNELDKLLINKDRR